MENDELASEQVSEQDAELEELEQQVNAEQGTEIDKGLQTALARARHWKKKYEDLKLKAGGEEKTGEEKKDEAVAHESVPSAGQIDIDALETRVFLKTQGYTPDEIAYMEIVAKGQNKKLSEAANDIFVQSGITGLRAEARSEQATPSPSNRSVSRKEKSFEEMTSEERKANWGKIVEKKAGKQIE